MPVISRNKNRSDRPGQGMGPCGAGQARGRSSNNSGMNIGRRGSGRGMGQGTGLGMGRRNGSCRINEMNSMGNNSYEESLEKRIIELEEENLKLREAQSK